MFEKLKNKLFGKEVAIEKQEIVSKVVSEKKDSESEDVGFHIKDGGIDKNKLYLYVDLSKIHKVFAVGLSEEFKIVINKRWFKMKQEDRINKKIIQKIDFRKFISKK